MESPLLPPRPHDSHKALFGRIGIVGGAPGMVGAALLAGRAALQCGAGLVTLGVLDEAVRVDFTIPELMFAQPDRLVADSALTVLAIGPGLGQTRAAFELVAAALRHPAPLVVDADGLNCLAQREELAQACAMRTAPTLLTPHAAEAAQLLGTTTDAVQADRLGHALELARRGNVHVVLKGCGSVIAAADGRWWINATGNAGLASAGSGDVLTGLVVALLAQGWDAEAALLAAVHLHGAAADELAERLGGNVGIAAGELIAAARSIFNRWIAEAR